MAEPIVRYYDEGKNPDGGSLPGVPLRDLTQEEYNAFPDWLKASIDAVGFYRTSKPRPKPAEEQASAPARKPAETKE